MSWMAWTIPTAVFFAAIALMLTTMTIWELISPTTRRRGFLPMATTRGDRLFISLLGSAFIHLAWLAATDATVVAASILCIAYALVVMRWG